MWPLMAFAGPVMQGAGKLFEGFARSSAGKMAAGIARSNAELLTTQADTAKEGAKMAQLEGSWKASQIGRAVRSAGAGISQFFSSNNMDPTSGSAAMLQGYSAAQGQTDMALAAARGDVGYAEGRTRASQIYGQAADQQWRAAQEEQKASTAMISGIFGAATSMLSMGSAPWGSLSGGGASDVMVGNYSMPRIGQPWEFGS